jgi:hypothetical protein
MRKLIIGQLAALSTVLLVGPAHSANTKVASGGYAYFAGDASCVSREWGRMRNTCEGQKYIDVAVETRATGSKTYSVYGRSSSSSDPALQSFCAAVITGANGAAPGASKWTAYVQLNTSSSWKTLGTLSVAADESVFFECLLPQSSPDSGTASGYFSAVRGF